MRRTRHTDIPLALPASRYGQDVASAYTQDWLGYYLTHQPAAYRALLAPTLCYLELTGGGQWTPVTLNRNDNLSTTSARGTPCTGRWTPGHTTAGTLDMTVPF
jgi:hypothetical protein